MTRKLCPKCGTYFVCNDECFKAGIEEGILNTCSCYCSSCAKNIGGYPKELMTVCPRFKMRKEKVEFT